MSDDWADKQKVADFFGGMESPRYGLDVPFFEAMGRRLVEIAGVRPDSIVLDVAAGTGTGLFPASERVGPNGRVTGIDLSSAMVGKTSKEILRQGIENARMLVMDAEELQFSDASYDFVLCGFALFFFPDLSKALSEFYRVLKPGGQFVAATFDENGYPWIWYENLLKAHNITHRDEELESYVVNYLKTASAITDVFSKAGFQDIAVSTETYDAIFDDTEAWWERIWSSHDRQVLADIEPDALERFKKAASREFQSFQIDEVLRVEYRVHFSTGVKH